MRAAAELADEAYRDMQERGLAGRTEREVAIARHARDGGPWARRSRRSRRSWRRGPPARCRTPCRATWRSRAARSWSSTWARSSTATARTARARSPPGRSTTSAREVYELVLRAQEEALAAVRAGAELPRGRRRGARDHRGGGPRRALRPRPRPRRRARGARGAAAGEDGRAAACAPGNVVTVEPGVYVPGRARRADRGPRDRDRRRAGRAHRVPQGPRHHGLIVLAGAAALVGALVQSATGFGFALVLSPALFAVLDPYEAVTTMLLLGPPLNVLVLLDSERGEVQRARCWPDAAGGAARAGAGRAGAGGALEARAPGGGGRRGGGWRRSGSCATGRRTGGAGRRRARAPPGRPGSRAARSPRRSASAVRRSCCGWRRWGLRPGALRASLAASFLALNLAGGAWWSWSPAGPASVRLDVLAPLLRPDAGGPRAGRAGVPPARGTALLPGGAGPGGLRRPGEPGGWAGGAVGPRAMAAAPQRLLPRRRE